MASRVTVIRLPRLKRLAIDGNPLDWDDPSNEVQGYLAHKKQNPPL